MKSGMSGAAVIAHGGGPTAVINASLAGVVEECRLHTEVTSVYGAVHGMEGILNGRFYDLYRQPKEILEKVSLATSSALGSSRKNLAESDLEQILKILRAHNIRFLFFTGGNGSMGTARQISERARNQNYELCVLGIPKTIDNDIMETDHCPGYASAARFFASAARDIGADNRALPTPVTFVEVMGRNTGWLAAATSLARHDPADAPHLIYFPERRLAVEQLLEDVNSVYQRLGRVVVAVCEGQLDEYGEPFGAAVRTGARHSLALNLAHVLSQIISKRLKITARSEKPGLLGRSSASSVSTVDREESRLCGKAAVQAATQGITGKMVALVRDPGPNYKVRTALVDLERVANKEKPFPEAWMNSAGNDVQPAVFQEYAAPLVGEISPNARLADIYVQPVGDTDRPRETSVRK